MSFLDIFKSTPTPTPTPAQQPVAQQAQQAQAQAQPNSTQVQPGNMPIDPNVTTPPASAPPATEEKSNSPLAEHKGLWENEPNKEEQTATPVQLTAENLTKVMAKTDFSGNITTEQMTAISAGGEDAVKALGQIINVSVQNAMVQSTLINDKLTQKAVDAAVAAQQGKIPELLRHQAISDHAKASNPIFKDPAVIPVLDAVKEQLAIKHPTATPAEITDMTKDIMQSLGKAFTPEATPDESKSTETDWSKFI